MALDATAGGDASDSYVTLAEFEAYCDNRGLSYSDTDATNEQALRVATQYLDNRYRNVWKGFRTDRDQVLAWPRTGDQSATTNYLTSTYVIGVVDQDGYEIDSTTIPQQIKNATFEAAVLHLAGTALQPSLEHGGRVARTKIKAGSVEKEIEYSASASARTAFTMIDGLLSGLVSSMPGAALTSLQIVRG